MTGIDYAISMHGNGKLPKSVSSCICRVVCGEFKNEGGGGEAVVGYFGIAIKASSQFD